MSSDVSALADAPAGASTVPAVAVRTTRLRWWHELLTVGAFYGIYTSVRNVFGSDSISPATALRHANDVIRIERAVGLYHEATIQHWFVDWRWFMWFWNVFYGSFHFVVTIGVLLYLFNRHPWRYRHYRDVLACTTALALIGFSAFPLMPPRLLGDCGAYGACTPSHFVDALREFGGLWSFDSGTMQSISNQYAAMPSLHFAWATWCWLAVRPVVTRRWVRVTMAAYPWLTLFAIVVTANHYWIDAAGGAVLLGVGFAAGTWLFRLSERHRPLAATCTNS